MFIEHDFKTTLQKNKKETNFKEANCWKIYFVSVSKKK